VKILTSTMEPLFERREYENGTQYWASVAQPIPGQVYYVRRIDEANQIYYAQQTYFPPGMGTNVLATGMPGMYMQSNVPNNINNTYQVNSTISAEEISGLHFGITIVSLFFPTLIYLIGFPFCHVRMKKFVQQYNNPALTPKLNGYMGVGWTCYVLHFALLIALCTFWIPTCRSYPNYSYDYNYGYSYSYYSYYCSITSGGIISICVIPALMLIFQITIISVGADLINTVKQFTTTGYSVVSTVPGVGIQGSMVGTVPQQYAVPGYVGAAGYPAGTMVMAARV